MESRCLMVRSSGVTPIAVTQSIPEIRILSMVLPRVHSLPICGIQRFPAGKAGLDPMPVLDCVFAKLPAQVDKLALPHIRKVTKPFVDILEQNAHILDLLDQTHQMGDGLDVGDAEFAEPVERSVVTGLLNFRMKLLD